MRDQDREGGEKGRRKYEKKRQSEVREKRVVTCHPTFMQICKTTSN